MVEPQDLISDSRAVHYWDAGRVVGRYYEDRVTRLGNRGDDRVEWDAYFLYSSDATWGEEPPRHVSWGRTIVDSRDRLHRDFMDLIQGRKSTGTPRTVPDAIRKKTEEPQ
jgi:hypothetical protein